MAWTIHSWDPALGQGEVVGPHFGPWTFGAAQNPKGTADFEVGEAVAVELNGPKDAYVVRSVVRLRTAAARLPGTECAPLEPLNARGLWDMYIDDQTADSLRLWVGDSYREYCPGWTVTYHGVSSTRGLNDDASFDDPWFRYASAREVREHELVVPPGSAAYTIVFMWNGGVVPESAFIVATSVEVAERPALWSP